MAQDNQWQQGNVPNNSRGSGPQIGTPRSNITDVLGEYLKIDTHDKFSHLGSEALIKCDPEVIYNQNHERKKTYGYITEFHIAGHKIQSKWKPHDPHHGKAKEHVTAVLEEFYWNFGQANAMAFYGYVEPEIRAKIIGLLHGKLKDSAIEFHFHIYKYDEVKHGHDKGGHGGYYQTRHGKAKGFLPTHPTNNSLMMTIGQHSDAQTTRCPMLFLALPAAGHESHIHVSEEKGHNKALPWGHKH
jgi:hypothetical protein